MTGSNMQYTRYDPGRYLADASTAARRGEKEYAGLARLLGPNRRQRILEVGCGSGSLLVALRGRGYQNCRGIELDAETVQRVRDVQGVDVAQGDWRRYLEGCDELFDAIIALDVFEHLSSEELLPTLAATRRRLAPGGRLIFRTCNPLCPFVLPTFCGDASHRFLGTPRLIEHLLREADFTGPIRVEETRPSGRLKGVLFALLHRLLVKPAFGLLYYHFHGEFPAVLTPNMIVCAEATAIFPLPHCGLHGSHSARVRPVGETARGSDGRRTS